MPTHDFDLFAAPSNVNADDDSRATSQSGSYAQRSEQRIASRNAQLSAEVATVRANIARNLFATNSPSKALDALDIIYNDAATLAAFEGRLTL